MKRALSSSRFWVVLVLFVTSLVGEAFASTDPTITRIRPVGANLHITASIPAGFRSATLESRGTNDLGAWRPRDIRRLKGRATTVVFRVRQSVDEQNYRLTTSATDPLPTKFYRGKKSFARVRSKASRVQGVFSAETARSGLADMSLLAAPTGGLPPTRTVIESDIWKVNGNRLYYFNQYRGLQILDITNPDSASLLGAVALPAAGEEMYLLGSYVVLLTRNDCGAVQNSELVMVDVVANPPAVVSRFPVRGSIQESRLVGNALYVASQEGNTTQFGTVISTGISSDWSTLVSSFDLSNPQAPVARGTLSFAGYGNVISATDNFLFVAVSGLDASSEPSPAVTQSQSRVHIIDIFSPNGAMRAGGSAAIAGTVADKFKINFAKGVLTVVSEVARGVGGTILETFSLANISAPAKLGQLEFADGERLFATRFDSNRVYIVTFEQIDPLWIVDISDPSKPEIKGHVEVPGFSTFIQPFSNRLITIGQDVSNGWRVAVSLFDVSDVSQPRLLSKVSLGENYSWSEAVGNEKAFNVMPEAGLILLPYQGDFSGDSAARVQLIDWKKDTLTLRGTIEHQMQPRRATVAQNRILSVSGSEFLAVNADDRDHPVVTRDLTLSWAVDRVILAGDYVLEFDASGFRSGINDAVIRIARAASPNEIIRQWSLGDLSIVGAAVKNDSLYLLQQNSNYRFDYSASEWTQTNSTALSVIDLTKLPELEIVGRTAVTLSNSLSGWNLKPLWIRDDLLVWESANSYWFFPMMMVAQPEVAVGIIPVRTLLPISSLPPAPIAGTQSVVVAQADVAGAGATSPSRMPRWFPGGGSGTDLVAFDVSDSAHPNLVSELKLSAGGWNTHNAAFATNDLVYLSHTEFNEQSRDNEVWSESYFLDVVDYSDAAHPTLRDAVSISGSLAGFSHGGNVLYTISSHTGRNDRTWLDALAYDGVRASFLSSLAFSSAWPHPLLIADTNIFLGTPKDDFTGTVETWNLSPAGKFTRTASTPLAEAAQAFALFGDLLVAQSQNRLQLIDASDPNALNLLGTGATENCLWPNLERAAGSLEQGLFAPLGDYGVLNVSE